jgi:hypothetical protein
MLRYSFLAYIVLFSTVRRTVSKYNVQIVYTGTHKVQKGYRPWTYFVKEKAGNMIANSHTAEYGLK